MNDKKLKLLFLCDLNRMRSPTAEKVFSSHPRLEVQSAGLSYTADKPVTDEHIQWADVVFVMEQRQHLAIQERFAHIREHKHIICLDIADEYAYMDPQLVTLLQERVFGNLAGIEPRFTAGTGHE